MKKGGTPPSFATQCIIQQRHRCDRCNLPLQRAKKKGREREREKKKFSTTRQKWRLAQILHDAKNRAIAAIFLRSSCGQRALADRLADTHTLRPCQSLLHFFNTRRIKKKIYQGQMQGHHCVLFFPITKGGGSLTQSLTHSRGRNCTPHRQKVAYDYISLTYAHTSWRFLAVQHSKQDFFSSRRRRRRWWRRNSKPSECKVAIGLVCLATEKAKWHPAHTHRERIKIYKQQLTKY